MAITETRQVVNMECLAQSECCTFMSTFRLSFADPLSPVDQERQSEKIILNHILTLSTDTKHLQEREKMSG